MLSLRGVLSVLGFAVATTAAAAPALNLPGGSPALQQQPGSVQIRPDAVSLPPRITGYQIDGCVRPGGEIIVIGQGFGSSAGRGIALGGHGIHVDLSVLQWEAGRIRARLPQDSRIQANRSYYIGIELANHGQWLSNIDRPVSICSPAAVFVPPGVVKPPQSVTTLPPPTVRPPVAGGTQPSPDPTPEPVSDVADPAPPAQDIVDEPAEFEWNDGGWAAPSAPAPNPFSSTGSLLERQLPPPPTAAVNRTGQTSGFEPGELVLVSADMQEAVAVAQHAAELGMRIKRRQRLNTLDLVVSTFRLPKELAVDAALQALQARQPEAWLDANHHYRLQQGESAQDQPGRYGPTLIGWTGAHGDCAASQRIGLVDTEVDIAHSSLDGQRILRHSVLPTGVAAAAPDHGTAVAALLLGRGDAGALAGLAPKAELYSASVFRAGADGAETTAEYIVLGLEWLAGQKVSVVGMSLGGPPNRIVQAAVSRLLARDVAIVAAAGNGGPDAPPVYPAAISGVAAVTAVDARRRSYRYNPRGAHISFAAPGVDLSTASAGGARYASGSSYATPFVVAALAATRGQPARPWNTVYAELMHAAEDLGPAGPDDQFGWGLIRMPPDCAARH